MEGSNQAGARPRPLTPMEGSDGPLSGFGGWAGALTPSGSQKFKGRPRDSKTIGSFQLKPSFPRSIDKTPTGACGVHQATAPSTQLVGCDGDWPACRALSVGTDERVKRKLAQRHRPLGPMEESNQAGARHCPLVPMNLKTAVDLVPERRNGYHCST